MYEWCKSVGYVLTCSVMGSMYGIPAAQSSEIVSLSAEDQVLDLRHAQGHLATWLAAFELPPKKFNYTLQLLNTEENYRVYRLTYPSPYSSADPQNNIVPAEFFVPRQYKAGSAPLPASIVLDILNGSAVISRSMAIGLAESGVAALYVPMAYYGPRRPPGVTRAQFFGEDPRHTVDALHQTVMDIRRAKAILALQPEIDPHRLGITGISLGGIVASLAAGVDGTFDRVVPILAGGDIAALTFRTRETSGLAARLRSRDINQDKLEDILAAVEPLNFVQRIAADKCLMINASEDEVVPRDFTQRLARGIGDPLLLWVPSGHYSAIFYLPTIRRTAARFLHGNKVDHLLDASFTPVGDNSR